MQIGRAGGFAARFREAIGATMVAESAATASLTVRRKSPGRRASRRRRKSAGAVSRAARDGQPIADADVAAAQAIQAAELRHGGVEQLRDREQRVAALDPVGGDGLSTRWRRRGRRRDRRRTADRARARRPSARDARSRAASSVAGARGMIRSWPGRMRELTLRVVRFGDVGAATREACARRSASVSPLLTVYQFSAPRSDAGALVSRAVSLSAVPVGTFTS